MADKLEAATIDAESMAKIAEWMVKSYRFSPNSSNPGYIVLHPDELKEIEDRYGSVDQWWKECTSGRQTMEGDRTPVRSDTKGRTQPGGITTKA